MKGLLVKDLRLLCQQKKMGLIYIFLALFMAFSMDNSFVISYIPMIALLLMFSTISYDNYDNGMPFLMTLPVDGKSYALEKYLLSAAGVIISWLLAMILQIGVIFLKKESFSASELLIGDVIIIPVFILVISMMIPIELKFGSEKGRMVLIVIFGIIAVVLLAGKTAAEFLEQRFGWDISSLISTLQALPKGGIIACLGGAAILLLAVSIGISIRVMNKKEY